MAEKKSSSFSSVSIPVTLYKAIEERIKGTEFTSVEAYVAFVLKEVLSEEEEQTFSEEDEAQVKQRLRDLGYLD